MKTDSTRTTVGLFDMRSSSQMPSPSCGGSRGDITPSCGFIYGYHVFLLNGALGVQLGNGGSHYRCGASNGGCTNYVSDIPLNDGEWHHVVITIDRDQPDGLRFHVNGELRHVRDARDRQGSLDLYIDDPSCEFVCPFTTQLSYIGSADVAMDDFKLYAGLLGD